MTDTPEAPDRLQRLLEKARALPRVHGVYLMKDPAGVVIYVGKASCLPDRVSSYFVPSTALGVRKQPMLEVVDDFDVIECESEWEALLTENRLIKDIHPRFNARLTDDKTFPYLAITLQDEFPGVFVTREPQAPEFKGAKIFGPFTSVYALRESVLLLQRVFKFRTCHLDIREADEGRKYFRPCLLYPIKQCTAPCAAKVGKEEYRRDVEQFVRFLESKRSVMLRQMKQEMEEASAELNFERAATLRDQYRAIEKLEERGAVGEGWQPESESFSIDPRKGLVSLQKTLEMNEPIRCVECIDIAHLQGGETVGSKVCFIDGRPFKNEYRRYKITSDQNDDYASIREVVSRRYREAGKGMELYPDVIIIDGGLGQLHAALEALNQLDIKLPMVISLAKKEELIYTAAESAPIRLSRNNHGLRLCQAIRDEAHRFAQHYHHILRRKKTLGEQLGVKRKKKRPQLNIPAGEAATPESKTDEPDASSGEV
ncbi:MAG: excinuclease ABC subunit UvrC [Planctomycetota bacterium]|nr:excinuclease ABC subunit UvrC [Planctomycetota bacterium]